MPIRNGASIGHRAAVIAAVLVGSSSMMLLAGCSNTVAAPRPAAAFHSSAPTVDYPVASCPSGRVAPPASGLAGAKRQLLPFVPTHALLCRYGQQSAGVVVLVAQKAIASPAALAELRARINSSVSPEPRGAVVCPDMTGAELDAYFWTTPAHHLALVAQLSGCPDADNGTQSAFIGKNGLPSYLKALTPAT